MGCDIHSLAEIKKNGKWVAVGDEFRDGYNSEVKTSEPFSVRSYTCFALLAGVRNNHDIKPICEPKGVPEDASQEYLEMVEEWDGDGHSHSYFTLEELFNVDWRQIVTFTSHIHTEDYPIFLQTNRPPGCSFFGDDNDPRYKKVTWKETLDEACTSLRYEAMPEMRKFALKNNLKDSEIRMLFFFDN